MDVNTIIIYLACIIFLFLFGRIFILPLKSILKLIGNSILGGLLLFVINLIGQMFSFHIGLNVLTAILVGLLGIPGAILLVILKLFL
ncbi:MAG: pro-sigmaK processing inhibitor BofA family protein [Clostridia bacterium]